MHLRLNFFLWVCVYDDDKDDDDDDDKNDDVDDADDMISPMLLPLLVKDPHLAYPDLPDSR